MSVKSVAHTPHAGGAQYLHDRVVTHGCTRSLCRSNGLQHCLSTVHTHAQGGACERALGTALQCL